MAERLEWLDALRGFNIFFIIGLSEVFNLAHHSDWNGLTFYDTIFPLFIFIAGLSIPLSLDRRRYKEKLSKPFPHIIIRTISLFIVGLMLNTITYDWFRIPGVLQRIAICYFVATIIYLKTSQKKLIIFAIIILTFYTVLMLPYGDLTPGGNLATKIDTVFFGGLDNEGILTTFPSIVTCLLGVFTMELCRESRFWDLIKISICFLIFGLLISVIFPINKLLWSPSYVLVNGAIDVALVLIFVYLFEVRRLKYISYPLKILGRNSIALYCANSFFGFWIGSIGYLGALILKWFFALWLYRSRIFIKL